MDTFWKGALAPITKHIDSVRFIDFAKMDADDWAILDYENLRPAALASLEKQIDECGVTGFYKVTYDQHLDKAHGGKKFYYYPSSSDVFDGVEGDKAISEFGNFDKFDEDVDRPKSFERKYLEVNSRTTSELRTIATNGGVTLRRARSWPRWALVLFAIKALYCDVDLTDPEDSDTM